MYRHERDKNPTHFTLNGHQYSPQNLEPMRQTERKCVTAEDQRDKRNVQLLRKMDDKWLWFRATPASPAVFEFDASRVEMELAVAHLVALARIRCIWRACPPVLTVSQHTGAPGRWSVNGSVVRDDPVCVNLVNLCSRVCAGYVCGNGGTSCMWWSSI